MSTKNVVASANSSGTKAKMKTKPWQRAPSVRYPYSEPLVTSRGPLSWLRGDRVLVWVVALLLGHAIARIINALMSDIIEPAFDRAFGDPDNKRPATVILGAKLKVRHFVVAIIQFIIIIAIAYAISGSGRRDPAYYRPVSAAPALAASAAPVAAF